MRNYFLLIAFVLLSLSCQKENDPANGSLPYGSLPVCDHYGSHADLGWISHFELASGPNYSLPTFNPSNSNQFIYQYHDNGTRQLRIYDISSNASFTVTDIPPLLSKPDWSSNDWVAFDNSADHQIWTVKISGDSLHQITNNVANLYPVWHTEGGRIYYLHSPVLAIPYFLFGQSNNTTTPDTILYDYAGYNDVSSNGIMVSRIVQGSSIQIGICDIYDDENLEFTGLIDLYEQEIYSLTGLTISPAGDKIYFTNYDNSEADGLFEYDINTQTLSKLIDHCLLNKVGSIDCSPDGNSLIMERFHRRLEFNDSGYFTGKVIENKVISLLDLSTMEETVLEL